jgi:hypothetical protein
MPKDDSGGETQAESDTDIGLLLCQVPVDLLVEFRRGLFGTHKRRLFVFFGPPLQGWPPRFTSAVEYGSLAHAHRTEPRQCLKLVRSLNHVSNRLPSWLGRMTDCSGCCCDSSEAVPLVSGDGTVGARGGVLASVAGVAVAAVKCFWRLRWVTTVHSLASCDAVCWGDVYRGGPGISATANGGSCSTSRLVRRMVLSESVGPRAGVLWCARCGVIFGDG